MNRRGASRPELEQLQEEVKQELAERAQLEQELRLLELETTKLRQALDSQIAKKKPKIATDDSNSVSSPSASSSKDNTEDNIIKSSDSSSKSRSALPPMSNDLTLLSTSSFLSAANSVLRHNLFQVLSDQRSVVLDISDLNREQKAEVDWVLSDQALNTSKLLLGNSGSTDIKQQSVDSTELAAYSLSRKLDSNPFDSVGMSVDHLTHYFKQIPPSTIQANLIEDISDSIQNNRTLHAECETKYKYSNNSAIADTYGFSHNTANYEFDEEDSANNIVMELDHSTGTSPQRVIKCATLNKLVEKVTHEKNVDLNTRFVFLLTYHSFTTPHELLAKLTSRYNVPLPPNINSQEAILFRSTKLDRIQIRVCSVLKNWLDEHYSDFAEDENLKLELKKLIQNMLENSASVLTTGLATGLANALAKREKQGGNKKMITSSNCPKPLISSKVTLETFNIMQANELELARQLTIIDFEKFRNIQPRECLNQNWSRKNKDLLAPNIIAMIDQFNKVSSWVQTIILNQKELNKRVSAFQKFIKIAEACRTLNNFNSLFAIYCGLTANPIHRLRKTKELIGNKSEKKFAEFKELFRGDKNSRNFRRVLQTTLTPCIPHLGIFLSDLTFTEDGNPDELLGMINFQKRCKLAERIRWIKQYQQEGYQLEQVLIIQAYFVKFLKIVDPETLWRMSKEVEPTQPEA